MKGTRSLLVSCFLAFALVHSAQSARIAHNGKLAARIDILPTGTDNTATATSSSTTTSSSSTSSTSSTSSSTSATSTSSETSKSSSSATSTSTNTSTSETNTSATQTSAQNSTPTQSQPSLTPSTVLSTAADGRTTVVIETVTPSGTSSSSASASATSGADDSDSGNSSGLGTGSIIGLSVAGGIAALGIVAFFIWKFTRKRFGDFDDNEAIKWPELNAHAGDGGDSHALPVHNTGRAGFDTGSEVSLSRAPSTTTHTNYSTTDFGNDPYSVPPLPHLNPNQPATYRDDPGAGAGYYDPYRGPVPGAFSEPNTATEWGPQAGHPGEAYPMTQMAPSGRASPGPTMMGRMSPGPGAMMRGPSPVPPMGQQPTYDHYGER